MPLGDNKLSADKIRRIQELHRNGGSLREIAMKLDISKASVAKWIAGTPAPGADAPTVEVTESDLQLGIRKALKKEPLTGAALADVLDVSPKRIASAVKLLTDQGAMIHTDLLGRFTITPAYAAEPGKAEVVAAKSGHGDGEWTHVFGALGDGHFCNKHSRLDVLNDAYKTFERMGITTVYNTGNWIDGEARFNKMELIVRPGMDAQIEYMIENYPQVKGITTHYVAGDDHEGWYQQREGIEIGRYLQHRSEDAGRTDLKYLGYGEADITLKNGKGRAIMRVVHPGGGSSYALSYTSQKRVESYQSGEKPHIELAGHYHKAGYFYPREVHCVDTGCTEDQTMFMRKKKLQAHVGYWVIKIAQDSNGAVSRFAPEFYPYFDRGYYRKDF